jgi:hypothetical protein
MDKIENIKLLLEEMNSLGKLPYIARFWSVYEQKEATKERTCYSSFYNGYVFTDLPTKPISTPFEFDENK